MTHKTKITTKETEEVSERHNDPVLAYRVGQIEIAMKDAALAQRESTESHKEGVKELATKMDSFAMNLATKADLEQAQRDADKEHVRFDQNFVTQGNRIDVIEQSLEGWPLAKKLIFSAVGFILLAVLGGLIALVVKGQP
jgi:hypothetical protein